MENVNFSISISDIAQIIIAIVNLFFAGYVIFYQIKKDKKTDNETAHLNDQNIKLQWFKELIFQPNKDIIYNFYNKIEEIKVKFENVDLSNKEKDEIFDIIKREYFIIKKNFIDVLFSIDKVFYDEIKKNFDDLIDIISNAIIDSSLNLKNENEYDEYIGKHIIYSRNNLIAKLYNYKGLTKK